MFLANPATAITQAFFTSQDSVENELVTLIDHSRSSIDMALFRFASRPLAQAIRQAQIRGVRVRIVLDGHQDSERRIMGLGTPIGAGEVRRLDGKLGGAQGIMHHKFVIFDKARLVTGSFNWTAGAEHVNYENALLTDAPEAVTAYGREFERLWSRAIPLEAYASGVDRPVSKNPSEARRHGRLNRQTLKTQTIRIPGRAPAGKKRHKKKKKRAVV